METADSENISTIIEKADSKISGKKRKKKGAKNPNIASSKCESEKSSMSNVTQPSVSFSKNKEDKNYSVTSESNLKNLESKILPDLSGKTKTELVSKIKKDPSKVAGGLVDDSTKTISKSGSVLYTKTRSLLTGDVVAQKSENDKDINVSPTVKSSETAIKSMSASSKAAVTAIGDIDLGGLHSSTTSEAPKSQVSLKQDGNKDGNVSIQFNKAENQPKSLKAPSKSIETSKVDNTVSTEGSLEITMQNTDTADSEIKSTIIDKTDSKTIGKKRKKKGIKNPNISSSKDESDKSSMSNVTHPSVSLSKKEEVKSYSKSTEGDSKDLEPKIFPDISKKTKTEQGSKIKKDQSKVSSVQVDDSNKKINKSGSVLYTKTGSLQSGDVIVQTSETDTNINVSLNVKTSESGTKPISISTKSAVVSENERKGEVKEETNNTDQNVKHVESDVLKSLKTTKPVETEIEIESNRSNILTDQINVGAKASDVTSISLGTLVEKTRRFAESVSPPTLAYSKTTIIEKKENVGEKIQKSNESPDSGLVTQVMKGVMASTGSPSQTTEEGSSELKWTKTDSVIKTAFSPTTPSKALSLEKTEYVVENVDRAVHDSKINEPDKLENPSKTNKKPNIHDNLPESTKTASTGDGSVNETVSTTEVTTPIDSTGRGFGSLFSKTLQFAGSLVIPKYEKETDDSSVMNIKADIDKNFPKQEVMIKTECTEFGENSKVTSQEIKKEGHESVSASSEKILKDVTVTEVEQLLSKTGIDEVNRNKNMTQILTEFIQSEQGKSPKQGLTKSEVRVVDLGDERCTSVDRSLQTSLQFKVSGVELNPEIQDVDVSTDTIRTSSLAHPSATSDTSAVQEDKYQNVKHVESDALKSLKTTKPVKTEIEIESNRSNILADQINVGAKASDVTSISLGTLVERTRQFAESVSPPTLAYSKTTIIEKKENVGEKLQSLDESPDSGLLSQVMEGVVAGIRSPSQITEDGSSEVKWTKTDSVIKTAFSPTTPSKALSLEKTEYAVQNVDRAVHDSKINEPDKLENPPKTNEKEHIQKDILESRKAGVVDDGSVEKIVSTTEVTTPIDSTGKGYGSLVSKTLQFAGSLVIPKNEKETDDSSVMILKTETDINSPTQEEMIQTYYTEAGETSKIASQDMKIGKPEMTLTTVKVAEFEPMSPKTDVDEVVRKKTQIFTKFIQSEQKESSNQDLTQSEVTVVKLGDEHSTSVDSSLVEKTRQFTESVSPPTLAYSKTTIIEKKENVGEKIQKSNESPDSGLVTQVMEGVVASTGSPSQITEEGSSEVKWTKTESVTKTAFPPTTPSKSSSLEKTEYVVENVDRAVHDSEINESDKLKNPPKTNEKENIQKEIPESRKAGVVDDGSVEKIVSTTEITTPIDSTSKGYGSLVSKTLQFAGSLVIPKNEKETDDSSVMIIKTETDINSPTQEEMIQTYYTEAGKLQRLHHKT
ncbi:serine-rich adhesin for platelets-like [Homalodisca vitripennis]|uniref:serine-rich adhesin for platelets-like n=1 Tax=Homalodisca vitripennis TaxID=197043 RepID=UPI001EEB3E75|nr:serine-rich adhesin for platelets-like [Homalodisca vitripennis]